MMELLPEQLKDGHAGDLFEPGMGVEFQPVEAALG
jgi:hypothetical protein